MKELAHRLRRVAATTVTSALLVGAGICSQPLTGTAHAAYAFTSLSSFDARIVHAINHARLARGLRALTVAAGTTDVAHHWSCRQAEANLLAHNPRLGSQLSAHGSDLWTTYAENVGVQPASSSPRHLFRLYMHSPEHRANILDPSMRFVGVWSKRGYGERYNTIDFVGSRTSSYDNDYGVARATC